MYVSVARCSKIPQNRHEAHLQNLLWKPVKGLGTFKMLWCVIRVNTKHFQKLWVPDRLPIIPTLGFQVLQSRSNEESHAVAKPHNKQWELREWSQTKRHPKQVNGLNLSCFLSPVTPACACFTKTRWRNSLRTTLWDLPSASCQSQAFEHQTRDTCLHRDVYHGSNTGQKSNLEINEFSKTLGDTPLQYTSQWRFHSRSGVLKWPSPRRSQGTEPPLISHRSPWHELLFSANPRFCSTHGRRETPRPSWRACIGPYSSAHKRCKSFQERSQNPSAGHVNLPGGQ